jgi:hypothetical protein
MCKVATEVICFMDRDEAGRAATEQVFKSLEGRMLTYSVKYGSLRYKDPGSMPIDIFLEVLQTADFF